MKPRGLVSLVSSSALAALLLGGCGVRGYEHDVYAADGRLSQRYSVTIIDSPLIDFSAKRSLLALPDGAKWNLNSPDVKTDPAAAAAVQTWGNAAMDWGMVALKLGGLP